MTLNAHLQCYTVHLDNEHAFRVERNRAVALGILHNGTRGIIHHHLGTLVRPAHMDGASPCLNLHVRRCDSPHTVGLVIFLNIVKSFLTAAA